MVLTIIRICVHTSLMIVCVCKAVSEKHIRAAGRDGATCTRDLTRRLGLGSCCGKCLPDARRVLSDSLSAREQCTQAAAFFPGNGKGLPA